MPERLGQHEKAVDEIDERHDARDDKGQARVGVAEKPPERRSDQKSRSENRADAAERRGALVTGRDVGDIGLRDRHIGREHAARHTA